MRPIKLVMRGFVSYAGVETIDFEKLGNTGLYLISGDTGAGKTTIFDAITYALFGSPSGADRNVGMLRSKYADISTPTEVELDFAYAGKIYHVKRNPEYERPKQRGTGTTPTHAKAELTLPDGNVITKVKEVDAYIVDILGLTKDQFCQIAMIAQGDFRKLLKESTDDRKRIFRRLFRTDKFNDLQELLKKQVSACEAENARAVAGIKQYIKGIKYSEESVNSINARKAVNDELPIEEVIELTELLIKEDQERENAARTSIENLKSREIEIEKRLDLARMQAEEEKKLAKAQEDLAKAQLSRTQANNDYNEAISKEAEIEDLNNRALMIEAKLPDYEKLDTEVKALADLEKKIRDNKAEAEELNAEQEKKKAGLKQLRAEQESLSDISELLAAARIKKAELDARNERISDADTALNNQRKLDKEYELAQAEYIRCRGNAENARNTYEKANRAYLDEQAGILAAGLEEGKPCPVCGSVTHPSPKAMTQSAPDKKQLEIFKKAADKAAAEETKASGKAGAAKEAQKSGSDHLKESFEKLGVKLPDDITAESSSEKRAELIAVLKIDLDEIKKDFELRFRDNNHKLKELQDKSKRKEELDKQLPQAEKDIEAVRERAEKLANIRTESETEHRNKADRIEEIRAGLEYAGIDEANAEIKRCRSMSLKLRRTIEEAREKLNGFTTEIEILKANIESCNEHLKDKVEIDAEADRQELESIGHTRSVQEDLKQTAVTRIQTNSDILDNIRETSEELIRIEKKHIMIKNLSDTANGGLSGMDKLALETYVQAVYLDRIVARANRRLSYMTDQQYELVRRAEADNKKSQSGLDLDVIDHFNGSIRSVQSLSGGEAFKASLSLALGLADEIQSSSGGIQIDTMFIDEGFGSLDEASLRQALCALYKLADGNRQVGIISHVPYLKEKISTGITVTKDGSGGSHCHQTV